MTLTSPVHDISMKQGLYEICMKLYGTTLRQVGVDVLQSDLCSCAGSKDEDTADPKVE